MALTMVNKYRVPGYLITVALVLGAGLRGQAPAEAQAQARRIEELEKRVAELERRLGEVLGKKPEPVKVAAPETKVETAAPAQAETRLPVSGYMDFHFNKPRGEPGQVDFHRFVLLFGHSFSDRIKFWSELELEHALVEGREEKGELELEQAYLDFLIRPYFNVRGGMLLAPVGLINERHEPPSFYGVERPFVDTVILPSTWFDGGAGVFGDFGKGFRYKAYLMGTLDATGFDASEGVRGGRQKGFETSFRNPALTGRLEYHGVPRLALGTSLWRGSTGFNVPGVNPRVKIFEIDGRYRRGRFDVRGEFAQVHISKARELNVAMQREGLHPNVAERLRGFYLEPAVRVLPRRFPHELALFARYENFDTQNRMPRGYVPLKQFDRTAWVLGATYYPEPDVALKFDYTFMRNASAVVKAVSGVNVGIGWWF